MLNVTLVRLAPDAGSADVALGQGRALELSTEEFSERLEAFRELDPLQNMRADPEIRVQAGSQKYVVQTGRGRLFLYNARDHTQPAQILTTAEVLAELDGSANAARTAAPFPGPVSRPQALLAGKARVGSLPPARPWKAMAWAAGAVLVIPVAWLSGAHWLARIDALPPAEAMALGQSIEGVYVHGAAAERGVVLGRDGAVRFFEAKGGAPPSIVFDRWRAIREGGGVRVRLVDRQDPIEIVDADTIVLAGERFQRAMKP